MLSSSSSASSCLRRTATRTLGVEVQSPQVLQQSLTIQPRCRYSQSLRFNLPIARDLDSHQHLQRGHQWKPLHHEGTSKQDTLCGFIGCRVSLQLQRQFRSKRLPARRRPPSRYCPGATSAPAPEGTCSDVAEATSRVEVPHRMGSSPPAVFSGPFL